MEDYDVGKIVGAIIGVVVVIFVIVFFAAATWTSMPPDKIGLHYTGGPFQGTHYKAVILPGSGAKFYGLSEHIYKLPATQRTYIISKDPNTGDKNDIDFVSAPSNDNVPFTFEAAVYFKLNPKPEVIRQFFEQVCLHDDCTDLSKGGGWDKMLAQYFRPQIENALRLEVGKYDREHLFRDPATLVAIQNSIGPELNDLINRNVGGEFFCGPDSTAAKCTNFGFVLKNPSPPDNVVKAYSDTAAASQGVVTAQQNADSQRKSAEGERDAQNTRASAAQPSDAQIAYMQAQAMQTCAEKNPNCTLVIAPGGTGVNVNTGSAKK